MNLTNLTAAVQRSLPADAANNITTWLNWAVDDFNGRMRWPHLEVSPAAIALVASQAKYSLVGATPVVKDFAGMIDVSIEATTGGLKDSLIYCSPQHFDRFAYKPATGMPAFYTVVGGILPTAGSDHILQAAAQDLVLWPTPLATAGNGVNIYARYYRSTAGTHMSSGTDVPITPAEFDQIIIALATASGLLEFDQEAQAQAMQGKAEAMIGAARLQAVAQRGGDMNTFEIAPKMPHVVGDPRDQNPAGGSAQS